MTTIKVKDSSEIPRKPHYAIIIFKEEKVTIPGDERSRTNPGHGYPGGVQTFQTNEYYVMTDAETFRKEMESLYIQDPKRTDVIGFHVDSVARLDMKFVVNLTMKD
jgi:hypothetical protein